MKKIAAKYFAFRLTGLFLVYFLLPASTFAQVKFYATTDSEQIEEGNIFELRFTLENAEAQDFKPPDLGSFELVAGPSRSSEMSVINGISKSKQSFIYSIKAGKAATYYIPPAQIRTGKKILKSNPLTIKVVKASKKDFSNISKNENFFIRAEISDKSVYPGQQILLKYKLYTSVEIAGIRTEYEPDLKEFKVQDVDVDLPVQSELINNRSFSVFTIKVYALYPMKTGKLTIPSGKFLIETPVGNSGNLFFQSTKQHHLSTGSIMIEVKKLPDNAPENFSGQVGDFKIKSRVSSLNQTTDEAFSLVVEIESDAFENSVTAPDFKANLKDFEIYDPKIISQSQTFIDGKLISSRAFEYLIVPKKEGKQSISIPYIFFDPGKTKYINISTEPVEINIKKSAVKNLQNSKSVASLKPSRPDPDLSETKKPFFGSFVYIGVLGLLFFILLFLYFTKLLLQKNKKSDPEFIRFRQADKEIIKRLRSAKELMAKNDEKLFFREIYNVLMKFGSDKLLLPQSEINSENLFIKLTEAGISIENANKFMEQFKKCETVLYSGAIKPELKDTFESVQKTISDLQAEFKSIRPS
jgi:hypothetical protein